MSINFMKHNLAMDGVLLCVENQNIVHRVRLAISNKERLLLGRAPCVDQFRMRATLTVDSCLPSVI